MKNRIICGSGVIFFIAVFFLSCDNKKGLPPAEEVIIPGVPPVPLVKCDTISFAQDIQPILNSDCVQCHYPNNNKGAPQYDYHNYAGFTAAKLPIIEYRTITLHDMPKNNPDPAGMSAIKKAIFKCWIEAGGPNN